MKLLMCGKCQDVFKLQKEERQCLCGETKGMYTDNLNSIHSGRKAIPIGFNNFDLSYKIQLWNWNWLKKKGLRFEAFLLPTNAPTMVKYEE